MNPDHGDAGALYSRLEPWVVLAAGMLITAGFTRNFSVLQLLREPIQHRGTIVDGVAVLDLPSWFPVPESVLDVAGGAIYARIKDLSLPTDTRKTRDQAVRLQIDLRRVPLPAGAHACSLTYFPWFRFLSEPVGFDAVDRVADYVAGCFRFMLVRAGLPAIVEGEGDRRSVRCGTGLAVDVSGMRTLQSVVLSDGEARTSFDFPHRAIEIDRRMFPAAHEAGVQMLRTDDRLTNVAATMTDTRLRFAVTKEPAHV